MVTDALEDLVGALVKDNVHARRCVVPVRRCVVRQPPRREFALVPLDGLSCDLFGAAELGHVGFMNEVESLVHVQTKRNARAVGHVQDVEKSVGGFDRIVLIHCLFHLPDLLQDQIPLATDESWVGGK